MGPLSRLREDVTEQSTSTIGFVPSLAKLEQHENEGYSSSTCDSQRTTQKSHQSANSKRTSSIQIRHEATPSSMPASKRPLSEPSQNLPAPKRRAGVTENLENADEAPVAYDTRALAPMVPDHLRKAPLPPAPQLRQGALAGVTARLAPAPIAPAPAVRLRPSAWAPMIPDHLRRAPLAAAQAFRRGAPAANATPPSRQNLNLNTYPNPSTCWPS
ncbi:hypothetical protein CAEBREN_20074 [Caenorhabditis brenneri]|uniref:Uncharacterized protein n=1 Tax=Caenorhabditis brenneri TaxID=135651 RepID=G0NIR3_CAEBE|nr:hypothetical protein CAEBREN_20074 [Caenorhabditis brenneri]